MIQLINTNNIKGQCNMGSSIEQKVERLTEANRVIGAISRHGRRFFHYGGSERRQADGSFKYEAADRTARLELRRGRLYFIDDYSEKAIYTHDTKPFGNNWSGFSHGGTLKDLVKAMRDYVLTGRQIHPGYIGLQRQWADGDIWGYGMVALAAVRAEIGESPMFFKVEDKP
jgi:hypothetical protein